MGEWTARGRDPALRTQNIEIINTKASKLTIVGWFIGLAYFNWFASSADPLPWWTHAVLVVGGMFAASILIGGGMSLVAAGVTRMVTGKSDGSIHLFGLAMLISPILAFFAAKYALRIAAALIVVGSGHAVAQESPQPPLRIVSPSAWEAMTVRERELYVTGVLEGWSFDLYATGHDDLAILVKCVTQEGIETFVRATQNAMLLGEARNPAPWWVATGLGTVCRKYRAGQAQ